MDTFVLLKKGPFLEGRYFRRHRFSYTDTHRPVSIAKEEIRKWLDLSEDYPVTDSYDEKLGVYCFDVSIGDYSYSFALLQVTKI